MAEHPPAYPEAVAPERVRAFDSVGVSLRLSEWGDPAAPPVVLCHGMFDHGRGFDLLAPLLAERFRVIAVDQRGHGESGRADAYPWQADVLDAMNVFRAVGPTHVVGHSKGGGVATDAAVRVPAYVRQLVNIDGFGPPPEGFTMFGDGPDTRSVPERMAGYLDACRDGERVVGRAYPALDDLVDRRLRQNPRLSREWLRYFVYHGARATPQGWVWKADLRAARGFGPFRPEWIGPSWRGLRAPMLAVIGGEPDTWGPLPESVLGPRLANVPHLERATIAGTGHFVHVEAPRALADVILGWLDR